MRPQVFSYQFYSQQEQQFSFIKQKRKEKKVKIVKKNAATKRAIRTAKPTLATTMVKTRLMADRIILKKEPIKMQRP